MTDNEQATALLAVVERQRNAALNRAANLEVLVDGLQRKIIDLEDELEALRDEAPRDVDLEA